MGSQKKIVDKGASKYMLVEVVWREEGQVPPLHDYLQTSTVTKFYLALSLISFIGTEASDDVVMWGRWFRTIIRNAATACRLMDDVSGHEVTNCTTHYRKREFCRVSINLPSAKYRALGKDPLCRV
jgi:hypothetical protein